MLGTLVVGALHAADPYRLVEDLFSENPKTREAARKRLISAGDVTMAPAVVEVIFFSPSGRSDAVQILEYLLGEKHGSNFKAWIEAIGRREDIHPRPGYLAFKARQYARIDPAFATFLQDTHPRTIRVEEIVFGGVRKDGIPALRNPKRIPAAQAGFLRDEELVFGVSINDDTRAYPLRIMDWHEMANDVIGGRAVALAYCTLCGAGILYDTTLSKGETYTFGSSGLLYRSNKLMYDHQTSTLWSHLHGEPVMGSLVGKGKKLRILPMTLTTWGEWRGQHPKTEVLSLETGYERNYTPGQPYGAYFRSTDLMFPVWKKSPDALKAKDRIFGLELKGTRKAYALRTLVENPVVNDIVAGNTVVLLTDPASEAVRAYLSSGRRLKYSQERKLVDEETGEEFTVEEEHLVNAESTVRLVRLAGHLAYWFGWYASFPASEVFHRP